MVRSRPEHLVPTLSRAGHPLLYLPEDPRLAGQALELYQPQTWRGRLMLASLQLCARTGMPLPLARGRAPWPEEPEFQSLLGFDHLQSYLRAALLCGNPHAAGRRFLALLFDEHGRAKTVVKFGRGREARRLILKELAFLKGPGCGLSGVPAVLHSLGSSDLAGFSSPHFAPVHPSLLPRREMEDLLGRWVDCSRPVVLGSLRGWQALAGAGLLPAELRDAEQHRVAHVAVHGDFAPWNLRRSEAGDLVAIDWERGHAPGMPAWDWIHALLQPALLVQGRSAGQLLGMVRSAMREPWFTAYARETGIEGLEDSILRAYLLYHARIETQTEGSTVMNQLVELAGSSRPRGTSTRLSEMEVPADAGPKPANYRAQKIAVLAAAGPQDAGGLAQVDCVAAWCHRSLPGSRVEVLSENLRDLPGHRTPLFVPPSSASPLRRALQPPWDLLLWLSGASRRVEAFEDHDVFVLAGSSHLQSSPGLLPSRALLLTCLQGIAAAATQKPVVMFPQSVGPLTRLSEKLPVRWLCRAVRVLTARDAASRRWMQEEGFAARTMAVPDITLALPILRPEYYHDREASAWGLGLIPPRTGGDQGDLEVGLEAMAVTAHEFHRLTGEPVSLLAPANQEMTGEDAADTPTGRMTSLLKQRGLDVAILRPATAAAEDMLRVLASCKTLLSFRTPQAILGLTAGVPSFLVSGHGLGDELWTQLGLGDWLVDPSALRSGELAERLAAAATDAAAASIRATDAAGRGGRAALRAMETVALRAGVILRPDPSLLDPETAATDGPAAANLHAARVEVTENPLFTIVTPSYRQLPWLKLCLASVADQEEVEVEHLVQDAGSGEELTQWVASQSGVRLHVERDSGMYDAINRGFRRARGEAVAWLNCDEQYLPGALGRVAAWMEAHPAVDVLFGDALLVSDSGQLLSYRKALLPTLPHIQLSHLNTLSCATFVRRKVLEDGVFLDTDWRAIADALWVAEMIRRGYQLAVLNEPLAAFTITQQNLGQSSLALAEMERWRSQLPSATRRLRPLHVMIHRLKKLGHGAYWPRRVSTNLYLPGRPAVRQPVEAAKLGFFWPG